MTTMEILSRHQFEVLGSAKVQEWTTAIPAKRQPSATVAAAEAALAAAAADDYHLIHSSDEQLAAAALAARLQAELRIAKAQHLSSAEVLLPANLLALVASDMVAQSEKEPCGIRGCAVYVDFEDGGAATPVEQRRRIAAVQVDAGTVPTFEMYLTLKHDRSGWTSRLPQFLKNLARSSTIMISPDYTLTKRKLYNSFSE